MTALAGFLRRFRRAIACFAALFLALAAGGWFLAPAVLTLLGGLMPGEEFYQMAVAEGLWVRVELSLLLSALVTLPLIALFVLYRVRRTSMWTVPAALLLFLLGMAFCARFLLPSTLRLLTGLLEYARMLSVDRYVSFCLGMLLVVGLLFEEPLVMYILYRLGVVRVGFLLKNRKKVFLAALIVLALLTPSGDAITLCVAMLPFILHYEAAVLWLKALDRRKERCDAGS
jgi:sec-independent protein translocase protein TatC